MDRINRLDVFYHDRIVGTMALHKGRLGAFEYNDEWLIDGFSISPFSLPLEKRVFIPDVDPFEGLFGVFSDSLPDGWGRLLVDRLMRREGMDPNELACLDRLAIVGDSGMGALTYRPHVNIGSPSENQSLDEVAEMCRHILGSQECENLDYLFEKGGSSGGARPKINAEVDGEEWIIKFPSTYDSQDIGKQEYEYALCAKKCGIEMEEVRLFPSVKTPGYFGTRRFDRNGMRPHMVSAAGLLETSHRIPNLDYDLLMKLTLMLTDSMEECEKLYRRMCFNVFAHNRDDHAKNFTYIFLEEEKRWILSPAYDLTYSNSIGGEHATTINGNGRNPNREDLLAVGKKIGIRNNRAKQILSDVQECVMDQLQSWI